MSSPTLVTLLAVVVAAYAARILFVYVRMRGVRVVVCPETRQPAAVNVDAGHSAVAAVLNSPDVRLQACSRWPERERCNQACVSQIAAEPRATLASERVKTWMADKTCAKCNRPFDTWHAVGPQPGVLSPDTQITARWDDIPAENLPALLDAGLPVCKHCQLFEDFRRKYPEKLLDRGRMS